MVEPGRVKQVTGRRLTAHAPGTGTMVMAAMIVVLGFFLIYPVILILINSFNVSPEAFTRPREWGLDNWTQGLAQPRLLAAVGNSIMIWGLTFGISMPFAVAIAWTLARARMPFSHSLELLFWVSYLIPGLATTIGWIGLLDPRIGLVNDLIARLPFVDQGPFNIFSVAGIVWVHLMGNGIATKVILLTPAFRNMDASMEEAARIAGASNLRTALRVTIPLMISPIVLVSALQLLRIFQSCETELLLGTPINFFVHSTLIYELTRQEPPLYGQATVLGSMTLLLVAAIIPIQRWVIHRRAYTTISATFRPGLIDLGRWKYTVFGLIASLLFVLTLAPMLMLVLGSFMVRSGYFEFDPPFTLLHWQSVLSSSAFVGALATTLVLATVSALLSPLLFSTIAYVLVRTRWRGRAVVDLIIWGSGTVPGIIAGLGLLWLFLGTPALNFLFGTIWALILVVILQGNTTGVNLFKGVSVQIGQEMEDAARIAGASWVGAYFRIWIPLIMPTLVLVGMLNFATAAGTSSSIILLASRETMTLSLLAIQFRLADFAQEAASVLAIVLMVLTVGVALPMRALGLRRSVQHR